jgi:glycosyltransferase involved in cell wall biosynthesis
MSISHRACIAEQYFQGNVVMNQTSLAPLFSVITPTWNRESYLSRVHEGLVKQHLQSFEWIVADDGSTDQTETALRKLAARSRFPITYIRADRHVGKVRMDNAAIKQARGKFILWCDSDDWLLPQALERLSDAWHSIPSVQHGRFVGLTALAATSEGSVISNPFPGINSTDVSWNDLVGLHRATGDMLICVKTDVLKANPFPEVDFVIPESVVWTAIGDQPSRLISEILLIKEYRAPHALSFVQTMEYNRGRAYSMATTIRNLRSYVTPRKKNIINIINFIRYSIHGDLSISEARKLWGDNPGVLLYWIVLPLAYAFAIKDQLQGKVRKTHLQFLAATNSARLEVEVLNCGNSE